MSQSLPLPALKFILIVCDEFTPQLRQGLHHRLQSVDSRAL